ncbi:hypothetical protein HK101_009529 [Irineochytrium annulatum]|nr:hypothetical protein HK101_009529 [Irineochytrium annulatum]
MRPRPLTIPGPGPLATSSLLFAVPRPRIRHGSRCLAAGPSGLRSRTYVSIHAIDRLPADDVYVPPPRNTLRAYDLALDLLAAERDRLSREIADVESQVAKSPNNRSLLHKLDGLRIELGVSQMSNHHAFSTGAADPVRDAKMEDRVVFEEMRIQRFKQFNMPRILKHAERLRIFTDAFPGMPVKGRERLMAHVGLNFPNTKWEQCYGHSVPANWALYSPEITISVNTLRPQPHLYTLLLTDLDRPNPNTRNYEEWAHWLITDIPVTSHLVIPGGSSPYLAPAPVPPFNPQTDHPGAYHPSKPEVEPKIPGKVVLPWVPPHPANSNPRKAHRYLMTLFRQKGPIEVDIGEAREQGEALMKKAMETKKPHERVAYGEGEKKIGLLERGFFPTWGFKEKYGLEVAGMAFFISTWNVHTSNVYTRLGIHEPVYGSLAARNTARQINEFKASTTIASRLSTDALASMSPRQLRALNFGKTPRPQSIELPTRASMKLIKMKKDDAELAVELAKKRAEKGKSVKKVAGEVKGGGRRRKLARITTTGAVGIVRSKEGDVAGDGEGVITRRVLRKRWRYKNV